MKLSDYLERGLILPDLAARTKSEVLAELVEPLAEAVPGLDLERARKVLAEREGLGTTGIGDGVAIPHGKMDSLEKITVVVGRSRGGVEYEALDHKPCAIFFLVLAPEQVTSLHLRILAHVSRLLRDDNFRRAFLEADGADGLWSLLKAA
jgi:PTS system nitrogen regulatory IIA component